MRLFHTLMNHDILVIASDTTKVATPPRAQFQAVAIFRDIPSVGSAETVNNHDGR